MYIRQSSAVEQGAGAQTAADLSLYCTSFSQHAYLSRSNGVRRQIFARRNKSFALLLRRVKSAD